MALVLTTDQGVTVTQMDTDLDTAFKEGATNGVAEVAPPVPLFNDLTPLQQSQTRGIFQTTFAAIMKTLNIKRALPNGISTTVTLAKLTPGGTNGSLTFVDGLLTAKVDPT